MGSRSVAGGGEEVGVGAGFCGSGRCGGRIAGGNGHRTMFLLRIMQSFASWT